MVMRRFIILKIQPLQVPTIKIKTPLLLIKPFTVKAVSYTHLDVYKRQASMSNQAKEASPANDYQAQKESQKEARKLMRQIESLEVEIEELETQSQAISEQMLETNDAEKLMELQAELDKISHRQEEAMLEWEELSEQV